MNSEPDPKLATQIDAALKGLPDSPAPSSLAHRVLAAIETRRAAPWWRRSWWEWPLAARVAFAVLAAGFAAILSGGGYVLSEGATAYSREWTERLVAADLHPSSFDPLWNAGQLLWAQAIQPLFHYAAVVTVVLYLICIGLGTACFRFAVKPA